MTEQKLELQNKYQEYLDNFDPSPIYYGDDYGYALTYEQWFDEEDE